MKIYEGTEEELRSFFATRQEKKEDGRQVIIEKPNNPQKDVKSILAEIENDGFKPDIAVAKGSLARIRKGYARIRFSTRGYYAISVHADDSQRMLDFGYEVSPYKCGAAYRYAILLNDKIKKWTHRKYGWLKRCQAVDIDIEKFIKYTKPER